ncbi:MAG: rod shape-determining protein RodA [Deltaproteobacteria bacterium]|nr:rod shape-determining protein RodA [Deltaproteobacteria bacterium]
MFDRRLATNFNWPLLLTAVGLAAMGLVNLYSATSSFDASSQVNFFRAQLLWTGIGFAGLLILVSIHYRHFEPMGYVLYGLSVFLLILVLTPLGKQVAGHQSWLVLGGLTLQPSELAKLGLIFGLSRNLFRMDLRRNAELTDLIPSLFIFMIPAALVVAQGDLGSSFFFALIYLSMILIHGVRFKLIAVMGMLGAALLLAGYLFFLTPYQKARVATFLHPEMDPKGAGYHLVQSKIAVGSGGLTGKGYLKGETHKLKFIPERHTDFIFPVLAEEWGFLGGSLVLGGFLIFLLSGLWVASKAADRFAFFLAAGVCSLFFWHLVINLGGVLGLMPLTGVPLPFFSYGGSALLTNWLGLALLLNVSMRRFMFT